MAWSDAARAAAAEARRAKAKGRSPRAEAAKKAAQSTLNALRGGIERMPSYGHPVLFMAERRLKLAQQLREIHRGSGRFSPDGASQVARAAALSTGQRNTDRRYQKTLQKMGWTKASKKR